MHTNLIKKFSFYIVLLILNLTLIEGLGFFLVKYTNTARIENFNVWDFTERVYDERFIIPKKNYYYKYNNNVKWDVKTSELRTRIAASDTEFHFDNRPKFLFIGDSVPFGWGESAENSIPYILQKKIPEYQVINGAVPSYSLLQAVKRFEYEFGQIKNIKYIYLQIYDPVSQYALNGSNWKENDNWNTFSDKQFNGCKFFKSKIYDWFYIHSNFIFYLNKLYRENTKCWTYSPPNNDSDLRLKNHIIGQITLLKKLVNNDVSIIVAPVTPSPQGYAQFNDDYRKSLLKVNIALRNSSNELELKFVDTAELLDRQEYFVDNCCHLSKSGADLVTNELANFVISENNGVRGIKR